MYAKAGLSLYGSPCGDPESFVRGSNFDNIFLVHKGREDPSHTISGLSLCGSSCGDPDQRGSKYDNIFFKIRGGRIQVPL